MTDGSTSAIESAFNMACDVYPMSASESPESLKRVLNLWKAVLVDLPAEAVTAGVLSYLSEAHQFRPSPGEIRKRALDLILAKIPSAEEEWGRVLQEMKERPAPNHGWMSTNAITIAILSTWDWWDFCMSTDKLGWRLLFLNAYKAAAAREEEERRRLPMVADVARRLRDGRRVAGSLEDLHVPGLLETVDSDDQEGGGEGESEDEDITERRDERTWG